MEKCSQCSFIFTKMQEWLKIDNRYTLVITINQSNLGGNGDLTVLEQLNSYTTTKRRGVGI
jgi:hypothetical protein